MPRQQTDVSNNPGQWAAQSDWEHLQHWYVRTADKLQALVYDILPSTNAVFSYAIGSRKLPANKQFFVSAQMVISLTQIISDVCFITDHVAYASSNKTQIVWIETELFLLPGVDVLMFMCVRGC